VVRKKETATKEMATEQTAIKKTKRKEMVTSRISRHVSRRGTLRALGIRDSSQCGRSLATIVICLGTAILSNPAHEDATYRANYHSAALLSRHSHHVLCGGPSLEGFECCSMSTSRHEQVCFSASWLVPGTVSRRAKVGLSLHPPWRYRDVRPTQHWEKRRYREAGQRIQV